MTADGGRIAGHWDVVSGVFHRILFARDEPLALAGAVSPQGRFHHDGQRALYLSPRVDWAAKAVAPYRRADDPPRIAVAVEIEGARIVDLRNQDHRQALVIDQRDADTPWLAQHQAGAAADSWKPADRVRASGADGMIYTARSAPERWHLVLFRWNEPGGPALSLVGAPRPVADEDWAS